MNTTGTVWLGLTIGCSQCHDHKFDPITQKDYYRFYAFFHNVPENGLDGSKGNAAPMISVPSIAQTREIDRLEAAIVENEAKLNRVWPEVDRAQTDWESSNATLQSTTWTVLEPGQLESRGKAKLIRQADGSVLVTGPNPDKDIYTITAPVSDGPITAIRLEALNDSGMNGGGPGRSINGNIVLTDVTLSVADPSSVDGFEPVSLVSASADFSQNAFPVAYAIDKIPETGWAIDPQEGQPHAAIFGTKAPIVATKGTRVRIILAFESIFGRHQFGKFRISVTSANNPHGKASIPAPVALALTKKPAERTEADRATIRTHYRGTVSSEGKIVTSRVDALKAERAALEAKVPTAMVMQEMAKGRDTFILKRGQYDQKGDKVTPGIPASLPKLSDDGSPNRLTLAKWLVRPDHPLVARVTVNRIWQTLFGLGLVKTAEDFGSQGELPSHPELLDWLAVEFVAPTAPGVTPWDVKAMVRLIVTSSAYRQSSRVTPELLAKDPENRLLARAPRLRLSRRIYSRWRAGCKRSARRTDWRGQCLSLSTYRPLGRAGLAIRRQELDRAGIRSKPRPRPLSTHDVHVLETDESSAHARHLRCSRPRNVHGAEISN